MFESDIGLQLCLNQNLFLEWIVVNFRQIPSLELYYRSSHVKKSDAGALHLMYTIKSDNSINAEESRVLFQQSSQSTCLLSTCLCANTVLYLCFERDMKMREVVQSGDYSQLNKVSDLISTRYLLCDVDKLFKFVSSSVLVILPTSYSCED